MSHIKCKYFRATCNYYGAGANDEAEWSRYWFCDSNDECIHGKYTRPSDCDPHLVNPVCKYSKIEHCQFEKNYKRYEYDEVGGLLIGRKRIPAYHINYLEIDGEVLVE